MALKFKITKAEYEKLSDELKGEYTLSGDSATLDLDGGPDPRANDKLTAERDRRRAAEKRATDAEARMADLEDKAGDVPALEAKHTKALNEANAKAEAAETKHKTYVERTLKDGTVKDLAQKLAGKSSAVILPHVAARVTVDMTGDEPKTVYLDAKGKPTTSDDLVKEFRDNKDFAAIIVGTHASGGGSSKQAPNGNGNPGHQQPPRQQTPAGETPRYASMKPADLAATLKANAVQRQTGST